MKIHVYLTHTQPAPWVDGLQAALPEHTVALWPMPPWCGHRHKTFWMRNRA